MPRITLPRCGECRRAIRGRHVINCNICTKKFHKNCFAESTPNPQNNFLQLYRLRVCSNCVNTVSTKRLSAADLNKNFQTDQSPEDEDDDIGDAYCYENSMDRYFDVNDTESLFEENDENNFFV